MDEMPDIEEAKARLRDCASGGRVYVDNPSRDIRKDVAALLAHVDRLEVEVGIVKSLPVPESREANTLGWLKARAREALSTPAPDDPVERIVKRLRLRAEGLTFSAANPDYGRETREGCAAIAEELNTLAADFERGDWKLPAPLAGGILMTEIEELPASIGTAFDQYHASWGFVPPTPWSIFQAGARAALSTPAPDDPVERWKPTHRHYKGGLYRVVARGRIEADLTPAVIYDNEAGETWVRPVDDFNALVKVPGDDGMGIDVPRFWKLPAPDFGPHEGHPELPAPSEPERDNFEAYRDLPAPSAIPEARDE